MSIRSFLLTTIIAASSVLPLQSAATAAEAHSSWCLLASFNVTQVASLYTPPLAGRSGSQRFAGAQLFLPAQAGLTAEWIAANIARHTAPSQSGAEASSECPLDVPGASVKVASGGTGFWVQVAANDADAAKEILNRARRLVR